MRVPWLIISCGLMALLSVCGPGQAACQTFTITATNVTMPSSGNGTSQFAITGIPVAGTLVLSCGYVGTLALGNLPTCPLTPPQAYTVSAGGTLKGSVVFYPPGVAIPASVPAAGLALGALVLVGWRRRTRGLLLLLCAMVVLAGAGACGGRSRIVMPPGTYPYAITAVNSPAAGTGPSYVATTTIMVTVK